MSCLKNIKQMERLETKTMNYLQQQWNENTNKLVMWMNVKLNKRLYTCECDSYENKTDEVGWSGER